MDVEVITLHDDDDCPMDYIEKQASASSTSPTSVDPLNNTAETVFPCTIQDSVKETEDVSIPETDGPLQDDEDLLCMLHENPFANFVPLKLDNIDTDSDDDDEYDPCEEIDLDQIENYIPQNFNFIDYVLARRKKKNNFFTDPNYELVNQLLNEKLPFLMLRDLHPLLPSEFVKKFSGTPQQARELAFKDVTYYIAEVRKAEEIKFLYEWQYDNAIKAGASVEEIEKVKKELGAEKEMPPEIKREYWDDAVEERVNAVDDLAELARAENLYDDTYNDDEDDESSHASPAPNIADPFPASRLCNIYEESDVITID
jgi:hypothetical protein